ncbi:hypothetical protein ADUPG1_008520 [Aduncisulcus paluster]|uniref:Receptor-like protein kinase n=1 Tax=Aduncisulcus paluster TaxID=2918883 RepID=A0ABQ5KSA0_9EUKA|nr:hypothetical protein ADUPG1_008520 [Aduncisulcus paluster]
MKQNRSDRTFLKTVLYSIKQLIRNLGPLFFLIVSSVITSFSIIGMFFILIHSSSAAYMIPMPSDVRSLLCSQAGYSVSNCDITPLDMAGLEAVIGGNLSVGDIEWTQYLIGTYLLSLNDNSIDDISYLSSIPYLDELYLGNNSITDLSELELFHHLSTFRVADNPDIYDISIIFKNIGMEKLVLADKDVNEFIAICHAESDGEFWIFLSGIFPFLADDYDSKHDYYFPDSCSLNSSSAAGSSDGSCFGATNCPVISQNQVYRAGASSYECSMVSKEGQDSSGNTVCYTIHDDNLRDYLVSTLGAYLNGGIIPIHLLRNVTGTVVLSDAEGIIKSLRGLEYATKLTGLNLCQDSSGNTVCYTIHDDNLRDYLVSTLCAYLNGGIIPIHLLRNVTGTVVLSDAEGIIKSLRGLEYATKLTGLNLCRYDLSGSLRGVEYDDDEVVYDRNVVKILTRHVSDGTLSFGLSELCVSSCGIEKIEDILDFPLPSNSYTYPFKLTSLDLSDNAISDVSILLTSPLFLHDSSAILSTLVLDNNLICDPDGVSSVLKDSSFFGSSLNLSIEDQTCMCSMPVSFSNHQVCRQVSPGRWNVECWKGYYYDEATKSCEMHCNSFTESMASTGCETSYVGDNAKEYYYEGVEGMRLGLIDGSSDSLAGLSEYGWNETTGDLFQLYIPDSNFRDALCSQIDPIPTDCDFSEFDLALNITNFDGGALDIYSITGAEYLISSYKFSVYYNYISKISPISKLNQLTHLWIQDDSTANNMNVSDLSSLINLNRLFWATIYGNPQLNDISVFYRNLGMEDLYLSYLVSPSYLPLCRSEENSVFEDFYMDLFPRSSISSDYLFTNVCSLNESGNDYCINSPFNPKCPSIIANQIYDEEEDELKCSMIAKEGVDGDGNLLCYTVHDSLIRDYLKTNCVTTSSDFISVDLLRTANSCSLLDLSNISADVSNITSLQGLEYTQGNNCGITDLILDGYDLSGVDQSSSYDRLVVQLLSKHVSLLSNETGLQSLSCSSCGISRIEDILDLTPIHSEDHITKKFKITSLNLSNNNISDVSMLITSDLFPHEVDSILYDLDLSGNFICDPDGISTSLLDYSSFGNTLFNSNLNIYDQTCKCTAPVSSGAFQVCREIYPERWDVECWNGYYYHTNTNLCEPASDDTELIKTRVCERNPHKKAVYTDGTLFCACRSAWYGDNCEYLYQVFIPDQTLRESVCLAAGYGSTLCDVSEFEMAGLTGLFSATESAIVSVEGIQKLIQIDVLDLNSNDISYISPVSSLSQLLSLNISGENGGNMTIGDLSSLRSLFRLKKLILQGNIYVTDLSMFYHNIGIEWMDIADADENLYISTCRAEDDGEYWDYTTSVFPVHLNEGSTTATTTARYYIDNQCSLGSNSCSGVTSCPIIKRNEVYQYSTNMCSVIAESDSGNCYTIHDPNIRIYLKDECLEWDDPESNGVISVATMRSSLKSDCSSLSLSDVTSHSSVSIDVITSLRGLEFAQGVDGSDNNIGLTSLDVSGYNLDGDGSSYDDRLTVQVLTSHVKYAPFESGLVSLVASGCEIKKIENIINVTPIHSGESGYVGYHESLRLQTLDLSNNDISDVSVLLTQQVFDPTLLTSLDLSNNPLCDVANIIYELGQYFTNITFDSTNISSSGCPCSDPIDFSAHTTCKLNDDGVSYGIGCWNGYYYDKGSKQCIKACPVGFSLSSDGITCETDELVLEDNALRCRVCENSERFVPVIEKYEQYVSCGYYGGITGDLIQYIDVPDFRLHKAICLASDSQHDND